MCEAWDAPTGTVCSQENQHDCHNPICADCQSCCASILANFEHQIFVESADSNCHVRQEGQMV
jgi:hypothetical protein